MLVRGKKGSIPNAITPDGTIYGCDHDDDFFTLSGRWRNARWCAAHGSHFRGSAHPHVSMYRVRDGKITEHFASRDDVGMLRQLGLLPPPPSLPRQ